MKSHVQVAVIGGGVVGCSVLYHLTKAGWKDVVLLERDQLTAGSTWHAAGGFHTLNGDPNVAKLQKYTIKLYNEIAELSGQATGFHMTGGVMLGAGSDITGGATNNGLISGAIGFDMNGASSELRGGIVNNLGATIRGTTTAAINVSGAAAQLKGGITNSGRGAWPALRWERANNRHRRYR